MAPAQATHFANFFGVKMMAELFQKFILCSGSHAGTAIALLLEWSQAQKLTVAMMDQKSPSFDDVFIRLIETEITND